MTELNVHRRFHSVFIWLRRMLVPSLPWPYEASPLKGRVIRDSAAISSLTAACGLWILGPAAAADMAVKARPVQSVNFSMVGGFAHVSLLDSRELRSTLGGEDVYCRQSGDLVICIHSDTTITLKETVTTVRLNASSEPAVLNGGVAGENSAEWFSWPPRKRLADQMDYADVLQSYPRILASYVLGLVGDHQIFGGDQFFGTVRTKPTYGYNFGVVPVHAEGYPVQSLRGLSEGWNTGGLGYSRLSNATGSGIVGIGGDQLIASSFGDRWGMSFQYVESRQSRAGPDGVMHLIASERMEGNLTLASVKPGMSAAELGSTNPMSGSFQSTSDSVRVPIAPLEGNGAFGLAFGQGNDFKRRLEMFGSTGAYISRPSNPKPK